MSRIPQSRSPVCRCCPELSGLLPRTYLCIVFCIQVEDHMLFLLVLLSCRDWRRSPEKAPGGNPKHETNHIEDTHPHDVVGIVGGSQPASLKTRKTRCHLEVLTELVYHADGMRWRPLHNQDWTSQALLALAAVAFPLPF